MYSELPPIEILSVTYPLLSPLLHCSLIYHRLSASARIPTLQMSWHNVTWILIVYLPPLLLVRPPALCTPADAVEPIMAPLLLLEFCVWPISVLKAENNQSLGSRQPKQSETLSAGRTVCNTSMPVCLS